jgi:polysaccharide pyruvyl transferase WcaK-like protein
LRNKINYVGYFVPGNQGDEALLRVNREIFGKYNFDLLPTSNPNREQHSQITLIGGGTIVPAGISWAKPTKYMYIFGVGVADPLFYSYEPILIDRLKRTHFRFFGVRGSISKDFLKSWGIKSEIIGDPVLSLMPHQKVSRNKLKIGINIGSGFKGESFGNDEHVIEEVTKICRILKKENFELVIVPFWTNNLEEIERLSKLEDIPIFEKWTDIEATLQLISGCRIFIGEKLHSIIFSAATNTPFVSLAYAPEHFDFADSVGFSKYCIRTDELTAEKILTLFRELEQNYEAMQRELENRVTKFREKQAEFADRIVADINLMPQDKWFPNHSRIVKLLWNIDELFYRKAWRIWKVWNKVFFLHVLPYII